MNKNEVFAHFSSILDNMLAHSLFFCTYFQQPCGGENFYGSIDDEAMPDNLKIRFGATRGCIVDDDYDYVCKFDVEPDNMGSCCEREISIYSRAKEYNLNQYFAEAKFLGTYVKTIQFYDYDKIERNIDWFGYNWEDFERDFLANEESFGDIHSITISIPLYGYPKAKPHLPSGTTNENEYIQKAQRIASPMRDSNLCVAIDFIREYGEEEYSRVTEFMYEENINDLHFANFGDVEGHYVAIDYSGYHDSYSTDSDF